MTDLAWMRPKLAELCGVKITSDHYIDGNHAQDWSLMPTKWRPDEDAAQAVRCLEAMHWESWHTLQRREGQWSVKVLPVNGIHGSGVARDALLTHAICFAIAAALEWKP